MAKAKRDRSVLDIPPGGLVWSTEVCLVQMTGKWSDSFARLYLRKGEDDEKQPPADLVKECKAARERWLAGERPAGWGEDA